jgi:hypothetical protein
MQLWTDPFVHFSPCQVAWARFAGGGEHATLCMLRESALTLYSLDGEVHDVPLGARRCSSIHPVPQGLLLSVRLLPARVLHACFVTPCIALLCRRAACCWSGR